jgi:hypothetical protein
MRDLFYENLKCPNLIKIRVNAATVRSGAAGARKRRKSRTIRYAAGGAAQFCRIYRDLAA